MCVRAMRLEKLIVKEDFGDWLVTDLVYWWWRSWQWCRTVGPSEHDRPSGGRIRFAPLNRAAEDAATECRAEDESPWWSSSYRSILVLL